MPTAKTIDELQLLENYLLALNFPDKGIVPFRILTREHITWDPYVVKYSSTTTPFPANGWKDSAKIGHPTDTSIDNILEIETKLHLYQLFYGIRQSDVRAYLSYPEGKTRRNIDAKSVSSRADFGFVDGSMSPYDDPKPVSEVWIPKDLDIGFAWHSRASVDQEIYVKWILNLYGVELIKDVDLVEKMIRRKVECRIATLGGVDSFIYDTKTVWGVDPIALTATREEIEAALGIK